jgi:TonB family protein
MNQTNRRNMRNLLTLLIICCFLSVLPSPSKPALAQEDHPIIYVKHLEPPLRYPPVARAAQLQGSVIVTLTIAPNGTVLSTESAPGDSRTIGYPLLREETEKLVKKWTFGCVNATGTSYQWMIKFVYRLEGEGTSYDDTKVVMDLPDQVTITVSPRECDHCPPKKKVNR